MLSSNQKLTAVTITAKGMKSTSFIYLTCDPANGSATMSEKTLTKLLKPFNLKHGDTYSIG